MPVGGHIIAAIYSGDGDFQVSVSDPLIQTVHKAKTAVFLTSANPFQSTVFGEDAVFNVQVLVLPPGEGDPSGLVDFFDGGVPIGSDDLDLTGFASVRTAGLQVGPHVITATYRGDDNFEGGNGGPITHTVEKAETTTTLSIFNSPSSYGEAFTVTAHVEVVFPGAGQPMGRVRFAESTGRVDELRFLNNQGFASIQVPGGLPVGTYLFQVLYEGDVHFKGSLSVIVPHDVEKARTQRA